MLSELPEVISHCSRLTTIVEMKTVRQIPVWHARDSVELRKVVVPAIDPSHSQRIFSSKVRGFLRQVKYKLQHFLEALGSSNVGLHSFCKVGVSPA